MNTKKGFTLIELMIAMTLFVIIVTIAVGGFVNALRTQGEVTSLIATQSNASLALEQMTREIRTGYLFCHSYGSIVPDTCSCTVTAKTWSCSDLTFQNAEEQKVVYSLAGDALLRSAGGGAAQSITGGNVDVQYLTFTLFGNEEDDHWNPRITISMGVAPSSTYRGVASDTLNLQTSVSAREIDCDAAGC